MLRFLLKRAVLTLPTFLALMFLTFMMIRLVPGDPIEVRRGERGISPERLAELRHEMGLDQPVWKQFVDYVWALLHGDFGTSIISHEKILTEFATLFPATHRTHVLRHAVRDLHRRSGRRLRSGASAAAPTISL